MPPFATTRARSRRRETRATRATVRDATHLRRGRDLRERESHGVRASRCDASGGPLYRNRARDRARARDRGRGDETIETPVIDDIDIDVRTPTHPWYRGRIFSIGHPFRDPRWRASFGMLFLSPDRRFAEPREVR